MPKSPQLVARLEAVRRRLANHAARPAPAGLTAPDPGASERWEAAQVWAHLAEIVGYWQAELELVIGDYDGTPLHFGRIRSDPGRIAAIEAGRHQPIAALARRADDSIRDLASYLSGLDEAAWEARGQHQTVGVMGVEQIVDRFLVGHLEEHADQLDGLAREA